ncbi:MAG: PEP-CTERM sorting domain-containing protein [Candidatus Omnitrophota bacterium]
MKRKIFIGFKVLFFIPLFLISTKNAFADQLWPAQVGDRYEYNTHDSANPQNAWTTRLDFGSTTTLGGQEYLNVARMDFIEGGAVLGTSSWYGRFTENAVYSYGMAGNNYETLDFQAALVGTTWSVPFTVGGIAGNRITEIMPFEQVNVPYGTFNSAYVYKTYFDPTSSSLSNSPYWYEYVVPGVGYVKQVNYWTSNYPTTLELASVTPEPASMLLFGLGGVSFGFFRRLKRKKVA